MKLGFNATMPMPSGLQGIKLPASRLPPISTPPSLRALSAAHAIALKARVGTLEGREVDQLVGYVGARLAEDDPVRQMVTGFVTLRQSIARDPAAMAEAGADLQRQVMRLSWAQPGSRVDIHG